MKNKIPCGGFYLDDTLNVNDSGELSIKGGTSYQQLVTDGDGNAKWEDRLAYVAIDEQVIFSQEDIAFTEKNGKYGAGPIDIPVTISVGEKVRVDFDGETYDCIAYNDPLDLRHTVHIGNGFIIGLPYDTGEPFVILNPTGPTEIMIVTNLTNPSHTVSITKAVETVHKIPEKFLSKGFIVNIVGTETGSDGDTYLLLDKTDEEINNALNNGSTVKLNYYGLNIQYDSDQDMFWGVFPNQVGSNGIITELAVVSVKKGANGWLLRETYITASTGAPSQPGAPS